MIRHAGFATPEGIAEHFFSGHANPGADFASELAELWTEYQAALAANGCADAEVMLLRFHLSDISNQMPILRGFLPEPRGFVSVVGQPPVSGRVALEAWHWSRKPADFTALWHRCDAWRAADSREQTEAEFAALEEFLRSRGGRVADHTVRTWLYCRDVDNNYAGLVAGRNRFFAAHGLTPDTHFIASTGIGGRMAEPGRLVKLDSLNFFGLHPGQLTYLNAPEMLSPTTLYGVSFERGTRLAFGDRAYCFISGTASIDKAGRVVHPNDVSAQTERMLDNVAALLAAGKAELADVRWATLYLRDPADLPQVRSRIRARLGDDVPLAAVHAPVCRPAWLVEMECVAVNDRGDRRFPALA